MLENESGKSLIIKLKRKDRNQDEPEDLFELPPLLGCSVA